MQIIKITERRVFTYHRKILVLLFQQIKKLQKNKFSNKLMVLHLDLHDLEIISESFFQINF